VDERQGHLVLNQPDMALGPAHVLVAQLSVAQTMYVNVRCGPIADCCVVAASHLLLLCPLLQAARTGLSRACLCRGLPHMRQGELLGRCGNRQIMWSIFLVSTHGFCIGL
jgi:hypothetical protein